MNPFLSFFVRLVTITPTVITVWLVSFIGYDQTFWSSTFFSLAGGAIVYGMTSFVLKNRFLKKHGLSRKEYMYISKNLKEAKPKLFRLHKALLSIKNVTSLKQRYDLLRVTRKIYSLTKKEPKRFYLAERFYFSHLDSALELTEKYVFLTNQPRKTRELEKSLDETRRTLEELTHSIEKDLYKVLSDDIDQLNFELDVAKHSIKKIQDSQEFEESRRLK